MRPTNEASIFFVQHVAAKWLGIGIGLCAAMVFAQEMTTSTAYAQYQPPGIKEQSPARTAPLGQQASPPNVTGNLSPHAGARYESNPILSLPEMFVRQWMPDKEGLPRDPFSLAADDQANKLTLKETIYLALRNNPGLGSVALDAVAASETVKEANAVFDPQVSSQLEVEKQSTPVSSPFQNPGSEALSEKFYDWNFGTGKVLSTTNGTLGFTFNNDRELTNTAFSPVNPVYTPTVVMSLVQPLLQNFGWPFATINVRLAESAQRSAQWNYGSSLNDFVERIGEDYWVRFRQKKI